MHTEVRFPLFNKSLIFKTLEYGSKGKSVELTLNNVCFMRVPLCTLSHNSSDMNWSERNNGKFAYEPNFQYSVNISDRKGIFEIFQKKLT